MEPSDQLHSPAALPPEGILDFIYPYFIIYLKMISGSQIMLWQMVK
jgi:hypothetical protein